jgi:hypothetical protein
VFVVLQTLRETYRVAVPDVLRRLGDHIKVDAPLTKTVDQAGMQFADGHVRSLFAELAFRLHEAVRDNVETVEHRAHGMAARVATRLDHRSVVIDHMLAGDTIGPPG